LLQLLRFALFAGMIIILVSKSFTEERKKGRVRARTVIIMHLFKIDKRTYSQYSDKMLFSLQKRKIPLNFGTSFSCFAYLYFFSINLINML
jgi:hypothetical protein